MLFTSIRRRISYANVIATIALFVALGGSSYAALKLPRNSVGSKQIKRNAVTTPKIKANAVTGAKVRESTLGKVPLAGAADALGKLDYNSASVPNPPSGAGTAGSVSCDPGQRAVGGGIKVDDTANQYIIDSYPQGTSGWTGTVGNGGSLTPSFTVTVICASSTGTS